MEILESKIEDFLIDIDFITYLDKLNIWKVLRLEGIVNIK